ncbi:hypothetical protein Pcinc_015153 [Petrolisthes cinctipes]|uniref:Uncharacterized protein n=1 Tax=Petrolisthes cinctipes TaxID=88211 RepID=A0AAE1KR38_PETCI|nr:hypothetical protein Pcinc_015153 [Petrolisthes cinctipes]
MATPASRCHTHYTTTTLLAPPHHLAHVYTSLATLLRCLQQNHALQAALPQCTAPAHTQAHLAMLHTHYQHYYVQHALTLSHLLATHCYGQGATLHTQLKRHHSASKTG